MILKRTDGSVICEDEDEEYLDDIMEVIEGLDLRCVDLRGVEARSIDFNGMDLRGADLRDCDLSYARMSGVDLRGATLPEGVPVVPGIDRAILDEVQAGGSLEMHYYHGLGMDQCGSSHCRAGWAIFLAGEPGRLLEQKFKSSVAGALIYAASRPDKPVPDFHCSDLDAMADLVNCAAEKESANGKV